MFFIKVKKHVFYVFYLQINVFIIYGFRVRRVDAGSLLCGRRVKTVFSIRHMEYYLYAKTDWRVALIFKKQKTCSNSER